MAKKYYFKGFYFDSEEEMESAKKENEAIEYIKAKTDLDNLETMVALYNKMIDRKMITTPVGLSFLENLRKKILKEEFISEDKLRPLPVLPEKKKKEKKQPLSNIEKLKRENLTLKTITFGLIIIIVGMFVIVLTGKSSPLKPVYEESVIDKYASWEEELARKTQWVNDKIYELEQQGIYLEDQSN